MAKFKIKVPKAGRINELGSESRLYGLDEEIEPTESWQEELMQTFVQNGWAEEIKTDTVEEQGEPVRARNDKGQLVGDDPSTPDVNEAWEGGKAPAKKKTTKKKSTKKSTTKKSTKKS